jgi:signal transduction histidine kinase/ligand-binding sensor domain-containing protein
LFALNPDTKIGDFIHTKWSGSETPFSFVSSLAQTKDGYLWLATTEGLFRFDGVRFTRFEPLSKTRIRNLLATRDGSLWAVFNSGRVSRLLAGQITTYALEELPQTNALAEDLDGSLVAATARGGLSRFRDGRWREIAKGLHHSAQYSRYVWFDRDSALWLVTENRLLRLPQGQDHFTVTGVRLSTSGRLVGFAQSASGAVWIAERSAYEVQPAGAKTEVRSGSHAMLFDRHGSLWIAGESDGVWRVPVPARIEGKSIDGSSPDAEHFTTADGLSGTRVLCSLEDREGNVWFGTDHGLDRFRESAFRWIPIRNPEQVTHQTLLSDGSLLLTGINRQFLQRVDPDGKVTLMPLPDGSSADNVCAGGGRTIWVNTTRGLGRLTGDQISYLPLPRLHGVREMYCMAGGDLWIADNDLGVIRYSGGKASAVPVRPQVISFFSVRQGQVWMTYSDGRISVYQDGAIREYAAKDGLPEGAIYYINQVPNGDLWLAGDGGLAKFENGRFRHADVTPGLPLAYVSADEDGSLWLRAGKKVLRMDSRDFDRVVANPAYRPPVQNYDALDGLRGIVRLARRTKQGLWVETTEGEAFMDPKNPRVPKNALPPPVHIEALEVDGKTLTAAEGMSLAPRSHNLQIEYTALSLTIPERVQFRYKLEGVDKDWQDPGTRRQAYYTDLPPKKYRFLVKASNNDGVWNEAGAALGFSVIPAWYQTLSFQAVCGLAALGVVMGLIRFRVHQVAASVRARFQDRLNERARFARQLHDTILQTVQASKIMASAALIEPRDPGKMQNALETLDSWLGRAVRESRSEVETMRASTTERNDLPAAIEEACREYLIPHPMEFHFAVEGIARELHPIVYDEVYRIGCEAVRNACDHSEGTRLHVELRYGGDLSLRVHDNGKGIPPEVAAKGRSGHFGLVGMRERAAQIKASVTVASAPGTGTEVQLVVPGKIAFSRRPPALIEPIRRNAATIGRD